MKDLQAATERVGRYQILDTIGSGPSGTVSRAKVFGVAGFERQFAVKRFLPDLTVQTQHAQALSSAARQYGSLEHPRIARMSEFGVVAGTTFTAVEHVAGLDAQRLLLETKTAGVALAIGGALALISQAARAVGYAHGRGLSHLGLSPTNMIVTTDGDVKVTDFGILAATMPSRPADFPRLHSRVPYLAPEQLLGEATSAATDVFVLGVLATELVTGHRAYRGDTPQEVANAILAGPPPEPPLPRPIVRVLQRCLARSPFERFPDARALADALDAALRVAPVPGTRKDIGAQVKAIVDRLGELNEGNLSGLLNVNVPGSHDTMPTGEPIVRSPSQFDTQPSPMVAPASTMPELPKVSPITVPGLAPPPIPVPSGIQTGGGPPPSPTGAPTMLGLPTLKRPLGVPPKIPSIVKPEAAAKPAAAPPPPPAPPSMIDAAVEAVTVPEPSKPTVDEYAMQVSAQVPKPPLVAPERPRPPTPNVSFESATGEMSRNQLEALTKLTTASSGEFPPLEKPPEPPKPDFATMQPFTQAPVPSDPSIPLPGPMFGDSGPTEASGRTREPSVSPATTLPSSPPPPPANTLAGVAPPPLPTPPPLLAQLPPPVLAQSHQSVSRPMMPAKKSKWPWVLFSLLLLGGLGGAGWFAYLKMNEDNGGTKVAAKGSASAGSAQVASGSGSAHTATASGSNVAAGSGSVQVAGSDSAGSSAANAASGSGSANVATGSGSAQVATTGSGADSGSAHVASAGSGSAHVDTPAVKPTPTGTSDSLEIASAPAGARVYIDGADQGKAPVKLPGTADRHNIALLLAGHELYVGEVDGHGKFDITMKPVTPHGGQAGIKVIKCKGTERYYVFVDGKPTGMMCPTERINTVIGPHTVEVYDAVSESRQKWDINVKDDRLSYRVRIDEK